MPAAQACIGESKRQFISVQVMIWVYLKAITDNRARKKLENVKKKVSLHRN